METPFANIVRVCERQHGLVTWHQLGEEQVTKQHLKTLVARGVLQRVRPRVYAVAGAPQTWERGLFAALLSAGEGCAASHASAARLCTFIYRPEDMYEITVPDERRPALDGVRIHRSTRLRDVDIVTVDGLARTGFERTICDCTTLLSEFQLGRVLDDGLRRGVASLTRLMDCAEYLESGPGRHMSVVRSLLAARDARYNPGGSNSELHVLDVLRGAGFPEPVQQHRVAIGRNTYFLDYAWPRWKIFAEWYGLPWHVGASSVVHDNDRLTDLSTHGWLPLIFTDAVTDADIIRKTTDAFHERGVRDLRVA